MSRVYEVNGQHYYSVTTLLSVIDKSGPLTWWASKTAVEAVREGLAAYTQDGVVTLPSAELEKVLNTAYRAHSVKKTEAADLGTRAHDMVEKWLRSKLDGTDFSIPLEEDERVVHCFSLFQMWALEHNLKPLEMETQVCSPACAQHPGYAGRLDILASLEGQLTMVDVKTSKATYEVPYFPQVSAYSLGWEGEDVTRKRIKRHGIIRIGRGAEDWEWTEIPDEDLRERWFKVFTTAANLYVAINGNPQPNNKRRKGEVL